MDRYGRVVAELILPGGANLNQEMVRAGLAWWYRKYAPADTTLKGLEQEAKAQKIGLWAEPNPIPPWDWRKGVRQPTTAAHTPTSTGAPCKCSGNLYNCSDFRTQAKARACFVHCGEQEAGDIHRLDGDKDGLVCESLP